MLEDNWADFYSQGMVTPITPPPAPSPEPFSSSEPPSIAAAADAFVRANEALTYPDLGNEATQANFARTITDMYDAAIREIG